jgi:single-strand DNA-binding protein
MGINKVILVGHVGKDPVVQYVKEDVPVARFTLATSETYRDKNGERASNTEWHNIVAWRNTAKVVEQYIKKGAQLYIEGKITTRSYDKDGVTRYITEIVANTIQMLGRPGDGSSQSGSYKKDDTKKEFESEMPPMNETGPDYETGVFNEGDDLPF